MEYKLTSQGKFFMDCVLDKEPEEGDYEICLMCDILQEIDTKEYEILKDGKMETKRMVETCLTLNLIEREQEMEIEPDFGGLEPEDW